MRQQHYIQIHILKNLFFAEASTYTQLKRELEVENSKFDFHLKKLIPEGYVEKSKMKYFLTLLGKEYASRIDTEKMKYIITNNTRKEVSIYSLLFLIYWS